jgi:hypothetical protein
MNSKKAEFENRLADDLHKYCGDPYGFVLFAFDWGYGDLKDRWPEPWQSELLQEIRDGLKTPNQVIQEAVASGHGVGKSALVAWVILWSISTKIDTRGVVTANTDTQLRTKTWPELGKWHNLFIAKNKFHFTATAIYSIYPDHEKTWRIDAIPWSEINTEAFAGLHNKGKRIVLIFDEASAVSDKIWEVSEGALTDSETEIIWLAFGNPTRNSGRFKDCFGRFRHRWRTRQIDSRTVSFTNKTQIQKWVDDFGEDSDFVRVRVRGVFPNASTSQFIPNDYVEMARGKHLKTDQYSFAPIILTLDNAWTGGDEVVIGKRQGLAFSILAAFPRNDDDMKIAGAVARFEDEHKADAVLIDYGYGTGVYSAGKNLGRNWILIPFGGASADDGFLNKRAEMWNKTKEWLKEGGAIPNDPILCADLVGPEGYVVATGKNAGRVYLESKEDMKARGLASPNRGDSLALSFALPVRKKEAGQAKKEYSSSEYDPMKEFNQAKRPEYNPMVGV